jgi:hypothetical protein
MNNVMYQMTDEDAYHLLPKTGFTEAEIDRLIQLRHDYRADVPLDYSRLRFARWLVQTGRLTDQTVEKDTSCASPLEKLPTPKTVVASISWKRQRLGLSSSPETWFYRQYHQGDEDSTDQSVSRT